MKALKFQKHHIINSKPKSGTTENANNKHIYAFYGIKRTQKVFLSYNLIRF